MMEDFMAKIKKVIKKPKGLASKAKVEEVKKEEIKKKPLSSNMKSSVEICHCGSIDFEIRNSGDMKHFFRRCLKCGTTVEVTQ